MGNGGYKRTSNTPSNVFPQGINSSLPNHCHNHLFWPNHQNQQIANMQFAFTIASLLSLASAAAVTKRYPANLVERQSGVCGALATPLCCQLDVLGVANLNCANCECCRLGRQVACYFAAKANM
ncbi:hypothetical protein BKA63DRAFT_152658 [Paraphoma chrysanthemicola]|nr:hypothetical protein BKA63DRAFT_152658 [Paraphoma chrysanthemicola]